MKRIVHTAVYKQKMNQYNKALKHYGQNSDQLLSEQATELSKFNNYVDAIFIKLQIPSNLAK